MKINPPDTLFPAWTVTSYNGKVLKSFATEREAQAWASRCASATVSSLIVRTR